MFNMPPYPDDDPMVSGSEVKVLISKIEIYSLQLYHTPSQFVVPENEEDPEDPLQIEGGDSESAEDTRVLLTSIPTALT